MPLLRLAIASAAVMLLAAAAFAHTVMTHSSIRDGDVLGEAPSSFDFGFADPVSLVGLELAVVDGDAIDIGFERVRGMQDEFSVPFPQLEEGNYVIRWRAVAQDGHVMRGEIGFELNADARADEHGQQSSGHDNHHAHHDDHHHGHHDEDAHNDHAGHGDMVGLIRSVPSDGATVDSGLERIELHFDHPMAVRSIQLSTLAMERITVEFEAQEAPVTSIEAATEPLDPGEYELSWRADGGDHEMSGTVRFTVE